LQLALELSLVSFPIPFLRPNGSVVAQLQHQADGAHVPVLGHVQQDPSNGRAFPPDHLGHRSLGGRRGGARPGLAGPLPLSPLPGAHRPGGHAQLPGHLRERDALLQQAAGLHAAGHHRAPGHREKLFHSPSTDGL